MKNTNVLVYQMGKVGSISIQAALKKKGLNAIHAHWMQGEGEYPTSKEKMVEDIKNGTGDGWKVICPIREPVARNVSAFFQSIEQYYPAYREYEYKEDVLESFLQDYNHLWPELWFDTEIMDVFDFDPFSEQFDHKQGYQIYEAKHGDILIIRLENANKVLSKAMKEFLGVRRVKMERSNAFVQRHNGTRVGKIYKEFMEAAELPEDFLDEMYDMRYAKHFYSEKEIANFKEKWSDNDKRNR
jgi:hypothetical protein